MGYRHNIGKLRKTLHEQIKDVSSLKELFDIMGKKWREVEGTDDEDDYNHLGCYEITTEIFELGKHIDDSYLKSYSREVFSSPELVKKYNKGDGEGAFYIISKEGFHAIIKNYHDSILSYYRDLFEGKEDVKGFLAGKIYDWDNTYVQPYNLDMSYDRLVRSWNYEYEIFELVRLYRSIDWDNYVITITAW